MSLSGDREGLFTLCGSVMMVETQIFRYLFLRTAFFPLLSSQILS